MSTDPSRQQRSEPETRDHDAPAIGEVGVVALVPDRWSEQWQPRHQVLSRLGRYFPAVWVNPAPGWRDVWREPSRFRVPDAQPEPGLQIHSPDRLLPQFFRPAWLAEITARKRLEGARNLLLRKGCSKIVLYVWRPSFAPALSMMRHDLSCYHIDDEYTFGTKDKPIPEAEQSLLERVDQVIIHSPGLMEKKGHINPHTYFVPNGVDFMAHAAQSPEPEDLRSIPRPRIGYTGWLKKQLDWDLLENLTSRHPDWSFVFVGSVRHPDLEERVKQIGRLSNVHILGGKSSADLARYPQHFDVCLMPYRNNEYTRYIYPLKLHEYLASGTATVGTPIRSLEAFQSVIELATEPSEWSAAIENALTDNSPDRRLARQAVAKEHDWENLVYKIAQQMADALGPEVADRLHAARPGAER
jgi:glycosyltransferase involved in cell wall biosynthesis